MSLSKSNLNFSPRKVRRRHVGYEQLEERRMLAVDFADFADQLADPLNDLQSAIETTIGQQQLPLVGDALAQIPPFTNPVQNAVDDAIRAAEGLTGQAAEDAIEAELLASLGPGGLAVLGNRSAPAAIDEDDIDLNVGSNTAQITIDLVVDQSVGVDFSIGLNALPFFADAGNAEVTAGVTATYQNFDIRFDSATGVDFAGFTDDVLSFEVGATLNANLPELQIGFLRFAAEDAGSMLDVSFNVGLSDNGGTPVVDLDTAELSGNASVMLGLSTSIDSNFPNVSADFVLEWDFINDDSPDVRFDNVSIGLGDFVSGFLSPIVDRVEPILDLVGPITDILTEDIPGLDQLNINVSLLDIANAVSDNFGTADIQAYFEIANIIILATDLVTNLEAQGNETLINFGTFDISGMNSNLLDTDASDDPLAISLTDPAQLLTGAGINTGVVEGLLDSLPDGTLKDQLSGVLMASQNGVAFDFPILNEPGGSLFKVLVGQNADLFRIRAQYIPPQDQDYDTTLGIPGIGISGGLVGRVTPTVIAGIGYDTFGIRQALQPGGSAQDLLQSFYLDEDTEFGITGELKAEIRGQVLVIAAGVSGGLEADIGAEVISSGEDAAMPNIDGEHSKVRFQELNGCAFHTQGSVGFGIDAFVEVGVRILGQFIGYRKDFDIVDVDFVSFDTSCLANPFEEPADPMLAELDENTGEVRLLMGPNANDRNILPDEIDESFEVVAGPDGMIEVRAFGVSQIIHGALSIVADGGDGNDSVRILEGENGERFAGNIGISGDDGDDFLSSTATGISLLLGGSDNDVIVGGFGDNFLGGGLGEDRITGGDNPGFSNVIEGNQNNDILTGGSGNNFISGNDGEDTITGGENPAATNNIDGGTNRDTIIGGMGLNIINGGDQADSITAGPLADIIHGGAGDDRIFAGAGASSINGDAGDDHVSWEIGDGAVTVNGGSGFDLVGYSGDDGLSDTFFLAPDADGNVRVMGPSTAGPIVSLTNEVEYISVDGRGGADNIRVELLLGTHIQQIGINPSDSIGTDIDGDPVVSLDFAEDHIVLVGSIAADELRIEQLEVDTQVGEVCTQIPSVGEFCDEVLVAQGGMMRVSGFPTFVVPGSDGPVGDLFYSVVLMNFDDNLEVLAAGGDDDITITGITGPTRVDGGANDDTFSVAPIGVTPITGATFLAELVVDGGAGANSLFVDHTDMPLPEDILVTDRVIRSNTLPGVLYGSTQVGNFEPGVIAFGSEHNDDIEITSTLRGATTIVSGDDGSDQITVASDPTNLAASILAPIAGRTLLDGGSGSNDRLFVTDSAAMSGNAEVIFDVVNVPEIPGDTGVEVTGLAGPMDEVELIYKSSSFERATFRTSDTAAVDEEFRILDSDAAHLVIEEQAGNGIFFVEAASGHVEILGGPGQDVVRVTQASRNVGNLDHGPLTFLGGGGSDRLEVYDENAPAGVSYQFFDESLVRTAGPGIPIQFSSSLERLIVNTSNSADNVSVILVPAPSVDLDQGGGEDTLRGPNTTNTWQIDDTDEGTLNDTFDFVDSENLIGGSGANRFEIRSGGGVSGSITGSTSGGDILDYSSQSNSLFFDLSLLPGGFGSSDGIDEFTEIDTVIGASGVNTLFGPDSFGSSYNINQPGGGTVTANGEVTAFESITRIVGGSGQDLFAFTGAGSISTLNGGAGPDSIDYESFTTDVTVDFQTGTATRITSGFSNIVSARGGSGDDFFRGNDLANALIGNGGADILLGMGANDVIDGGAGRDFVFGGDGADFLSGGDESDIVLHGRTSYDNNNDAALFALLDEWTRTGIGSSYNARVANVRTGGGLTQGFRLSNSTVLFDLAVDTMQGLGGLDWFWREVFVVDTILDQEPGEQVN